MVVKLNLDVRDEALWRSVKIFQMDNEAKIPTLNDAVIELVKRGLKGVPEKEKRG